MSLKIVRSEAHALATTPAIRADVERTIAFYRRVVRCLASVAITHWHTLGPLRSKERLTEMEALVHATKLNIAPRYPMMGRIMGKMPSYLRRAAIHAGVGAASSYLSNYSNWLDESVPDEKGERERELGNRPPRLGFSNVFPSLYGGNMLLEGKDLKTVQVKVLREDGTWGFTAPLQVKGRFKRLARKLDLSPTLMMRGEKVWLTCPVELSRPRYTTNKDFAKAGAASKVCSIDVGINTAATAAIVDASGTVIARKFFTCGRHNDQRDNLAEVIASKRQQTGKPIKGQKFCSRFYNRIAGLSIDAARQLSSQIAAFAASHGVKAFAVEDLKGWKPKGPSKRQRQRFHRFQHRVLINCLALKAEELGIRMLEVYARGTSRYAYDGSGKVKRSTKNAQLATFSTGKQYNADLNGALNIAARGLASLLGVKAKEIVLETGKSSGSKMRMPLVLSDIWEFALRKSQDAAPAVS